MVGLLVFDGFFELKQLEGVGQLNPKKSDTYLKKRFTKNHCWHCYMAPIDCLSRTLCWLICLSRIGIHTSDLGVANRVQLVNHPGVT